MKLMKQEMKERQERSRLIQQVTTRGETVAPEFWTREHIAQMKHAAAEGQEPIRVFVGVPEHWPKERGNAFEAAVIREGLAELIEKVDLDLLQEKKGDWSEAVWFHNAIMTCTWNRIWMEGWPVLEVLIHAVDEAEEVE